MGDEYFRLIQVFGYEKDGGYRSILWNNPLYFSRPGGQAGRMLDDMYEAWISTKRPLTAEEVVQGYWQKIGDKRSFNMVLRSDGTLSECETNEPTISWEGNWKIVGPFLRVNIGSYELDVIGNRDGNCHSGLEMDGAGTNSYFKIIHQK